MLRLKIIPFLLIAILVLPSWMPVGKSCIGNDNRPVMWIVDKTSMLKVNGRSNLSEFSCEITQNYKPDTIYCYNNTSANKPVRLSGCVELDVFGFNCHNEILTRDLRKTIKANEHPKLSIRFISLDRLPANILHEQYVYGTVEIALAGATKRMCLPFEFIKRNQTSFILNGKTNFCFSDFKLIPPSKLGGIIKVKDDFSVAFSLSMVSVNH
jgi:hypothetical protein